MNTPGVILFPLLLWGVLAHGEVVNIRHIRSRSHLTRPNHLAFGLGHQEFATQGTTWEPPDATEGVLLGLQVGEDSRHHPKDDAEDLLEPSVPPESTGPMVDVVTRFLRIVESQQQLGENCTAGTGLNLGEGVVDRYAQVGCVDNTSVYSRFKDVK